MQDIIVNAGLIFLYSAFQSVSFCMSSRARNRDHENYARWATAFAAATWYLAFREVSLANFAYIHMPTYIIGAVIGNAMGAKISMRIERKLNASADGHLDE